MKLKYVKRMLSLSAVVVGVFCLFLTAIPQNADAALKKKDFGGIELTIATFPSTWEIRFREEVGPQMEMMNVKLKFIGGRAEQFLAKMIAAKGTPTFDVVEVTDHVAPEMMAGNFLDKLDLKNIPNVEWINPGVYNDYKVGYWTTQAAIVFNHAKLTELGIPFPTEVEDLLHPKLKGKVIFPTLSSYNAVPYIVALAKKYGGDEANIDPALPVLRKFSSHVHSFADFTPMSQAMKNGDIYATLTAGNGAIRILKAGIPMAVNHLVIDGKEGVPSFGYLGVVKGSKHKAAAEAFINEAIGLEMAQGSHLNNGIVPTHKAVLGMYADRQPKDKFGTYFNRMQPEAVANMYYMDFDKIDRRKWGKKLQRVQVGK